MRYRHIIICWFIAALVSTLSLAGNQVAASAVPATNTPQNQNTELTSEQKEQLNTVHLPFIRNVGQIAEQSVKYYADTWAGRVFITDDGLTYTLHSGDDPEVNWAFSEAYVNSNTTPILADEPMKTSVSYFKGENADNAVPTYENLKMEDVYQHVDVSLHAQGNNIEKIFTVAPGGDPHLIKMEIKGTTGISVNKAGELMLGTGDGHVAFTAPVAFQEMNGQKKAVEVAYEVNGNQYGFHLGEYDKSYPLIIDPLLASTYIGGAGNETINDMVVSSSGDVYLTGNTASNNFPVVLGRYTTYGGGSFDVFVAKFSNDLTRLKAATYIGGSGSDYGYGIGILDDDIVVAGYTQSTDFPHTVAGDLKGGTDGFVARFNPELSVLKSSAIFGGTNNENIYALAIDKTGSSPTIIVAGDTRSSDLSVSVDALQPSNADNNQVGVITKFNENLQSISTTYLGGATGQTFIYSVDVSPSGMIIVGGETKDLNFPVTPGAYDTAGNSDGFVAVMNSNLRSDGYYAATFLGGTGAAESVKAVKYYVDSSGTESIYASGISYNSSFQADQITTGMAIPSGTAADAFIIKLKPDLTNRISLTCLGGSNADYVKDMAVSPAGEVLIGGYTKSTNFPVTEGQAAYNSASAANVGFVTLVDKNLNVKKSSIISNSEISYVYAVTYDQQGVMFTAGHGTSKDLAVSPAYQTAIKGANEGFVLAFNQNSFVSADSGDSTPPVWSGSTLTVNNISSDSLTISWPAAFDDSGVNEYLIYKNGLILDSVNGATTEYNVTGLSANQHYLFSVEAKDNEGNWTAYSLSSSEVTTLLSYAPVWYTGSGLTVHYSDTYDHLQLRWPAATDDGLVTGYKIYQQQTEVTGAVYGYSVTDAVYYSDIYGLDGDTEYTFKVEAQDNDGYWSRTGPDTTVRTHKAPDTYAPYWPVGNAKVSYLYTSLSSAIINWPAAIDNEGIDHYRLTVTDRTQPANSFSQDVAGSLTSYEAALFNLHNYSAEVKAVDAAGNTSTVMAGEVFSIPEAPYGSGTGGGTGNSSVPNPFVVGVSLSSLYSQYNAETKQSLEVSTFGSSLENAVHVPLKPFIKVFFYHNVSAKADSNRSQFTLYEVAGQSLMPVPVEVSASSNFEERRYLFVSPTGVLKPETTYKLVIGKDVVANNNKTLGYDKEVYFTTNAVNRAGEVQVSAAASYVSVGADSPDMTIQVPTDVTNASLDLSARLVANGAGVTAHSLPSIVVQNIVSAVSSSSPVEVRMPQGTSITGPLAWNGMLNVPQAVNPATTGVAATPDKGMQASVTHVVEIGAWDIPLTTDRAVRIVFPGQADKLGGYFQSGVFTKITREMSEDSQAAGDALPAGDSGRIAVGNDLVIWAKHFTQFVLYKQTSIPETTFAYMGSGNTPSAKLALKPVLDVSSQTALAKVEADALKDAFAAAVSSADGRKTVSIELEKVEGAAAYGISLPSNLLTGMSSSQWIQLKTEAGELRIPGNMLHFSGNLADREATIVLSPVDKALLTEAVRVAVGDHPVLEVILKVDGEAVAWSNAGAPVVISMPYTATAEEQADAEHLTVLYLSGEGSMVPVSSGRYDATAGQMVLATTHLGRYAVAAVFKTFGDLNEVPWAQREIEVLASKGIIAGTSETAFTPGAEITRADYLTLLVRTLGLSADVAENFSDVQPDAYYYQAVGIAKALGIAEGAEDGGFRPQDTISRQDMMVLTRRALQAAGKLQEQGTDSATLSGFPDKADIADYAQPAIAALVQAELIAGSADGLHPLDHATRAEAAVFLYRIYRQ